MKGHSSPRVLSIQVGGPRPIEWRGKLVTTSIFKEPVRGPVAVRRHNLAGDEQSDLSVHGGPAKAVYAYPSEHYAWWREQLPGVELPWGVFGENLTTDCLLEADLCIGDRLRIGSAELQVTQPRIPCFKLGIRFGRPELVKRFLRSGRSGFYLAVAGEGEIAPGDGIEVVPEEPRTISVAELARLHREDGGTDPEPLRRAIAAAALPEEWREGLRARLAALES